MKFFTKKSTVRKIILACIILLLINFTAVPYISYADDDDGGWTLSGSLAKELMQLLAWFGDVSMGFLNNVMLGANTGVGGLGSAMLSKDNPNLKNEDSWLYVGENEEIDKKFNEDEIDTSSFWPGTTYEIPNMLYSPESIFANNIAALDVNFLKQNTYESIYVEGDSEFQEAADEKATSAVEKLRTTIASWYKSFRNIAVVGLLSVLIYLGIRILISSAASDKAKYKQSLQDWLVALCLVFIIHFIMSAVLMMTDKCTDLFSTSIDKGITVKVGDTRFRTNLMGLVRFQAQSKYATVTATYVILYLALVIYTFIFTFMYFKRFLYMAFFTMIAPLVALTYPLDKIGDGKSQAFNMWFKEYTMNAIIQPVHLIIYTVFVTSAYDLAINNPLYALVAMGFLIPAEKFVKKMFGLDKAETTSGFGSFAGGAIAMSGLKQLAKMGSGGKESKNKSSKDSGGEERQDKDIFMPNKRDRLDNFKDTDNHNNEKENNEKEDDNKAKEEKEVRQLMLDTDDESFGTNDWDAQQRDVLAREESKDDEGMQYSDEDYRQILEDSGYDEDTINEMMAEGSNTPNEKQNISPEETEKEPKVIKGYRGRVVGRVAKSVGKQLYKHSGGAIRTGLRVAGTVAGATVGVAAGITTGDLSKTVSYMGAGALAGNAIGGNIQKSGANLVAGAKSGVGQLSQTARDMRNAYEEEKYGLGEARKREIGRQNARARKEFLKDDNEKAKYKELAAKMDYKGDIQDLMNAAADYKEAGITDDKLIQNSLKAEYKRDKTINGSSHDKFVDIASFSQENGFGREYIDDDKKRNTLEGVISSTIKNPEQQKEAGQMFAEIYGRGDYYKSVGTLGKANIQQTQTTNNVKPRTSQNPNSTPRTSQNPNSTPRTSQNPNSTPRTSQSPSSTPRTSQNPNLKPRTSNPPKLDS